MVSNKATHRPKNVSKTKVIGHKPTIRLRAGFAIPNLRAASHFALSAAKIERKHFGEQLSSFYDEIRYNVLASVLLSVASLEANINELLADKGNIPGINTSAEEVVVELLEQSSILDKYQSFLRLRGFKVMDGGSEPFQSAAVLVRLRNSLVHFKPEWHDEQNHHARIGSNLLGKFELSPFFKASDVVFPERSMSAGCANWAVCTALSFMKTFHDICGCSFKFGDELYDKLVKSHCSDT
jgi:hypothetical protein